MTNYKTTIGGALSVLGTTLVGVGIVPQLAGVPSHVLTILAVVGFGCSALGKFLTALFAADATQLKNLQQQMTNTQSAVVTGDTTIITKNQ